MSLGGHPATLFPIVPYLCFLSPLSAQVPKIAQSDLSAQATAVEHPPKLDGTLDDPLWRSDLYVIYNEGTQFASIAPANPPQVRETRFAVKYTYSFAP